MALRDRFRNESQQDIDDKATVEEALKIWDYLRESRRRLEYEWFINDQFYNNKQYLQYDPASRRLVNITPDKQTDKIVINKVKQQVRGIVNFLTSEKPQINVRPADQKDDSYIRSKSEKKLADYWYRHLDMEAESNKVALYGAKYGIGWSKVVFDRDATYPTAPWVDDNGKEKDYGYGELATKALDTFEVYWDPLAEGMHDMRYIIHAVPRTIAELKNNNAYRNTDRLSADRQTAASKLKQAQIRMAVGGGAATETTKPGGMDTVIVLELFRRRYVNNKWVVWLTTLTEGGTLLRDEEWGYNSYPFEYFLTDISGKLTDSQGVIHDIREPNRALNQIVSQIQTNARVMGQLNWLIPRGSNVNVIDDTAGQFIEYDVTPGGRPQQATNSSLPAYVQNQVGLLNNFIQDIGGMHDSFNGSAPFSQASGDLVNSLAEGDQNNLTTLRSNFDKFHVRWFKLMFRAAKANYTGTRKFPDNKEDVFGQTKWLEIKPSDIDDRDDLDVITGTAMPYSNSQKQQMYMNLWKEKAIQDPKVLFHALQLPDIDDAFGDDEADIERQLGELKDIIKNNKTNDPLISEDHNVHISVIDKFCKSDAYYELTPAQQQAIQNHRQKHITFVIQLAKIAAAQQFEPIKRSEAVMLRMNKMSDTTAIERTQLLGQFGINSDAGQIQLRGGLYIQDPAQAETQAQNEDIEMLGYRQVQVSFGDNHIVHLQTHQQVVNDPNFQQNAPDIIKNIFKQHISDHQQAMAATQVAPGLVPNDQVGMPNMPSLNDNSGPGDLPKGNQQPTIGNKVTPAQSTPQNNAKPVQNGGTMSPADKIKPQGVRNVRRRKQES